jgi:hypothetical protein
MPSRLERTAITLVLVALSALAAAAAGRILESSVNHIGVSPYILLLITIPGAIVGGCNRKTPNRIWRRAAWAVLILCIACTVGAMVLDHANILVSTETWLERGQPERPF